MSGKAIRTICPLTSSSSRFREVIVITDGESPLFDYMPTERLAILEFARRLFEELQSRPVEQELRAAAEADASNELPADRIDAILEESVLDECIEKWEAGACAAWRKEKMRLDGQRQMLEIERHKYLISKEKGYDVGWEVAARDWVLKYAKTWREWWETQDDAVPPL